MPFPPSQSAVVRSALWAAYGDALGFPAELANERMFADRLEGQGDQLGPWTRRIGGRMGAHVLLPAGATSDDTQLRLAVGRCIRTSGRFDAETFSKLELPVFLSYELGAGRGTKAAARNLLRRPVRWSSNFFDVKGGRYIDGGGNGAAMRVQPHVWAARDGKPATYLRPILRDVLTTHGHPRGLLGACLHAMALGAALHQQQIPAPDRWPGIVGHLHTVADLIAADEVLSDTWLPAWRQATGRELSDAVGETVQEVAKLSEVAAAAAQDSDADRAWPELASTLGGLNPATRGSATISAVLSLWIAHSYARDPAAGLRQPAHLLGSDTDTVASMAGALLGAVADHDPPAPILDAPLIAHEARRLHALAGGQQTAPFPHPDPLRWEPPQQLVDALGLVDGQPHLAGLGPVQLHGEPMPGQGKSSAFWQWAVTEYGQTMLVKRRAELRSLPNSAKPRNRPSPTAASDRGLGGGDPVADTGQAETRRGAASPYRSDNGSDKTADPRVSAEAPDAHQASGAHTPHQDAEQWAGAGGQDIEELGRLTRHWLDEGPLEAAVFVTSVYHRLHPS